MYQRNLGRMGDESEIITGPGRLRQGTDTFISYRITLTGRDNWTALMINYTGCHCLNSNDQSKNLPLLIMRGRFFPYL